MNTEALHDKVAFVTGGGSGIGNAAVWAFARAGARVAVIDIRREAAEATAAAVRKAGGKTLAIAGDLGEDGAAAAAVRETIDQFGQIDYAFNNAGIGSPAAQLVEDVLVSDYDHVFATNVRSVFLCMKFQLAHMRQRGQGAIVNTASMGALVGSLKAAAYIASKHAVLGLTRATALDYAKFNVRVNAVCPGLIRTPMFDRFAAGDPARLDAMAATVPMGRFGNPEEIAQTVLWLCSDAASYVTGAAITVDGGFTAA